MAYAYDLAGRVTNVVRETGARRQYGYDTLDRLVSERHYDAQDAMTFEAFYEYDLAGNRIRTVIDGETNVYTLGIGDRLADWEAGSYAFDAAGCVTARVAGAASQTLAWDSLYRLTSVSTNGQTVESYQYDALDRRIKTTTGTNVQWHIHAGPHVVADVDAAGNLIRSYTHGPGIDDLLTLTVHDGTNSTTYAYVKDRMGTVLALVDEAGDVVESYDYDAWGNVLGVSDANGDPLDESAIGNRYLFQGRDYSCATGLYHFRARWYDPVTGRWLSKDPIRIAGGLNLYVFCGNNPVAYRDPFGLCEEEGYWRRSLRQLWYGNLTDEVTVAGTAMQILTGIAGIDILGDVRDIAADLGGWEWSWSHAGLTGLDIVGVLPLVGVLKYSDEVATLAKGSVKSLSGGEIKKLIDNGIHPHDLKPNSKYDLFKDSNGNIIVRPKSGAGPGDPTGININDL